MRAQCIICQELFENNDEQVISALWCGHTFHNACLNQWLENGRTCPSCRLQVDRRKIVQRLYFDAPEDNDEVVDDSRLQNEIDNLRAEVRRKEKEKNDVAKERERQNERIAKLQEEKKSVDAQLKAEQSNSSSQLKTLRYYESQQKSLEQERQECRRIKQKMVTLQSLEVLLNGAESDAADIISTTGEGSAAVQSLSRQVAFLKREYEKLKLEKRQIKDHYDKLHMNELNKSKKLQELTKDVQLLKDQLNQSEGDLKITEKHLELLKDKNKKLVSKLKRVTSTVCNNDGKDLNNSSVTELMNDSGKVQAFASSTPKLTQPSATSRNIDLDQSFDLFETPSPMKQIPKSCSTAGNKTESQSGVKLTQSSQSTKRRHSDEENVENTDENAVKYLKITSASQNNAQKLKKFKSESAVQEANPILKFANMNIFKKRELGDRHSNKGSVVQKGFDGLGGHTTHINSMGNPFKKPATKSKKTHTKTGLTSKSSSSLPKLDNFIVLD